MPALVDGKRPRPTGGRRSADERRDQVLKAAVAEFALHGLHGASTEMIAQRAGISQPYVFRLFPSKKDLFIAAVEQCFARVRNAFAAAAREAGKASASERLHAMGHAYLQLLTQREQLLLQMQAYAACSDPDVRRVVRQGWADLNQLVRELAGASPVQVSDFFAKGMFMNVVACIDLAPKSNLHEWSHEVLGFR